MKTVVWILVIVLMVFVSVSALADDISFSIKVDGHTIAVTHLSNGKSFVKINEQVYEPVESRIEAQSGELVVVVLDGQLTWIDRGGETVSISPKPDEMEPVDGVLLKIGEKSVYRSSSGFDTVDGEILWDFSYYVEIGKKTFHVLTTIGKADGDAPPSLFQEVVKTLAERRPEI